MYSSPAFRIASSSARINRIMTFRTFKAYTAVCTSVWDRENREVFRVGWATKGSPKGYRFETESKAIRFAATNPLGHVMYPLGQKRVDNRI